MGYDPDFIRGFRVPLPTLGPQATSAAFAGGAPVEHTRFSLVLHEERGLAIYAAHTIDGASLLDEGDIRRRNRFRFDPEVPRTLQVDNDRGYRNNPWDRGHLVRRRSLHWGDRDMAARADSESFYWTNIVPQHEHLHDTAWGDIEDWMLGLADDSDERAVVFTGPVLRPDDPTITNRPGEQAMQIPAGFWKVIAIKATDRLRAAGFLVWQRDFSESRPLGFTPFLEQVRLTTLEYLTGLAFGELRTVDPLRFGESVRTEGPSRAFGVPGARSATGGIPRSSIIGSASDIYLPLG